MIRIDPIALIVVPTLLLLAGCGHDLFAERGVPRTSTEVAYAKTVCDEAGLQSRACDDARRQMDIRCYRTIGTVDCYRTDDPFGMSDRDRAALAPIDRRPTRSTDLPPEKPLIVKIPDEGSTAAKPADAEDAATDAATGSTSATATAPATSG